MKWYFAINESGSNGSIGKHARLAVQSAARNTDLKPHMLYSGNRNSFTEWMEAAKVTIIDGDVPFKNFILDLHAQGRYLSDYLGHWLRTSVCMLEQSDEFVLYTDCDVIFRSQPELSGIRPAIFACAPEFTTDNWNYVNTGVMVMNVPGLRADYPTFLGAIEQMILKKGNAIRDQYAYNQFYRGRWERLDPRLNWKPYWGINEAAPILHFHGPKLDAIRDILNGKWDWSNEHGKQIGALFAANLDGYRFALQATLDAVGQHKGVVRGEAENLLGRLGDYVPPDGLDTSFMSFRMFGE